MPVSDLQAAAERMRQAFDLFEAGLSMKRAQLRRAHPKATTSELDALVRAWLRERAGAEHGDAAGKPRRLDALNA
jgi:hypothetical protein